MAASGFPGFAVRAAPTDSQRLPGHGKLRQLHAARGLRPERGPPVAGRIPRTAAAMPI